MIPSSSARSLLCWPMATLLLSAACHTSQPAESDPLAGRLIGSVSAREYIELRTGIVVAPHDGNGISTTANTHAPVSALGTAAVIDRRGCLLAAAHVAAHPHLAIVFQFQHHTMRLAARVVWRGNVSSSDGDLALLHVAEPLPAAFAWSARPKPDTSVYAAGTALDRSELRYFLGVLEACTKHEGFLRLDTNLPLGPGDSGGPLLDMQGRLPGINAFVQPNALHS